MAFCKRVFDKYDSLDSVCKPTKSAKVHGIVTSLSPMKGDKYFDGCIADNTTSMRLVGFAATQQKELATQYDKKQPVVLENCAIHKSRFSDSMEVVLSSSTKVATSPRKFSEPVASSHGTDDEIAISLDQLQALSNFQKVRVTVKVLRADNKVEVKPGLFKQDLCISDATAAAELTLWQDSIDTLVVDKCYILQGLHVRSFDQKKYLTPPKAGFTVLPKEDIGDVKEPSTGEEDKNKLLSDVRVVGARLNMYSGCVQCSAKVVADDEDPEVGQCVKCSLMQCLDVTTEEVCAELVIMGGGVKHTLRAFGKRVAEIAQKPVGEITMRVLLKASPFNAGVRDGIIQSVSRKA